MMTLEQIEARLRSAAVPAIHLSASQDDTASKMGGLPDVAEGKTSAQPHKTQRI